MIHEVTETVAIPHTYTLLIWSTTMVTVEHHGLPDLLSVVLLLVGACSAYVVVGRVAHHRHGNRPAVERRVIAHPYLVASGNIVTLIVATGVCWAVSIVPLVHLAWLLSGLAGTTTYLIGVALQAYVVAHAVPVEE
ncbi:hypothetical protein [Microbacterium elymi]|uniref:Uncharacterized protein n=1 Tax=Microbacterium elymi TaxID=2909587 RepID=A0ABY5NM97_9MICO|nr:hypothetical protein [Microbacterium elymi]UUT36320.1 hypothetical protein L2X98_25560 [Microbacterium elymi]